MNRSFSSLSSGVSNTFKGINSNFYEKIGAKYGSQSENGSQAKFWFLLVFLVLIVLWLPSVTYFTKVLHVSNFIVTLSIFLLLAYSLNLHTGMTGRLTFGVIFFAAVGAYLTTGQIIPGVV